MSMSKGVIPANTKPSTQWCVQLFKTLLEQRSIRMGEGPESATPPDILQSHDVDPVYRAMHLFVLEAQRVDGENCGRGVVRTVSCTLVIQNSFY